MVPGRPRIRVMDPNSGKDAEQIWRHHASTWKETLPVRGGRDPSSSSERRQQSDRDQRRVIARDG
jgi:hypothetical protein